MKRICLAGLVVFLSISSCLGQGFKGDKGDSKQSFESVKKTIQTALENKDRLPSSKIREFMRSNDGEQKKEILKLVLQEMRSRIDSGGEYRDLLDWLTSAYDCGASVAEQEGLYSTLIDIVKRGSKSNRERAIRALMRMEPQKRGDQELVHDLFRKAGSVVLQLAILWDIESDFLKKEAKSCINGTSDYASKHEIVEIYPYSIVAQFKDEIEEKWEYPFEGKLVQRGLIENKWDYWGGVSFRSEKVYAHDLALAYLAWMGDKSAKRKLKDSYKEAPDPKGMRDAADKDKRYWHILICLLEIPDDMPPDIPPI